MNNEINIGVVGVGSMGGLHARTVANSSLSKLTWVCDQNPSLGKSVAQKYDTIWIPELDLDSVDAVVVAVPTEFHYKIAVEVLTAGVPLLMEKPLALTLEQVHELAAIAKSKQIPLQCGLLERFNPAIRTALDLAIEPISFRSIRHSPLTPRISTGVASDLLIHDLDLALRCFGRLPDFVRSMAGTIREGSTAEDSVEALLSFGNGKMASLSASRMSQRKVRTISITEHGRLIEVDLLRQDITIYRHVLESPADDEIGYRQQTIIDIPVLKYHGEPLMSQLEHFCHLVKGESDLESEIDSLIPPHSVLDDILNSSRA